MKKLENIIDILNSTKNTTHKAIIKRLIRLYQKLINEEPLEEENEITRRCYNILLEIVDEDTKRDLLTRDGIIKVLSSRIERESSWTRDYNNNFYLEDVGNHFRYEVNHNNEGYDSNNNVAIELDFIEANKENLDKIHSSIEEKERVLNSYRLKDETDLELAEEIISLLDINKVKEKVKSY
jgi:hypothetical protein